MKDWIGLAVVGSIVVLIAITVNNRMEDGTKAEAQRRCQTEQAVKVIARDMQAAAPEASKRILASSPVFCD